MGIEQVNGMQPLGLPTAAEVPEGSRPLVGPDAFKDGDTFGKQGMSDTATAATVVGGGLAAGGAVGLGVFAHKEGSVKKGAQAFGKWAKNLFKRTPERNTGTTPPPKTGSGNGTGRSGSGGAGSSRTAPVSNPAQAPVTATITARQRQVLQSIPPQFPDRKLLADAIMTGDKAKVIAALQKCSKNNLSAAEKAKVDDVCKSFKITPDELRTIQVPTAQRRALIQSIPPEAHFPGRQAIVDAIQSGDRNQLIAAIQSSTKANPSAAAKTKLDEIGKAFGIEADDLKTVVPDVVHLTATETRTLIQSIPPEAVFPGRAKVVDAIKSGDRNKVMAALQECLEGAPTAAQQSKIHEIGKKFNIKPDDLTATAKPTSTAAPAAKVLPKEHVDLMQSIPPEAAFPGRQRVVDAIKTGDKDQVLAALKPYYEGGITTPAQQSKINDIRQAFGIEPKELMHSVSNTGGPLPKTGVNPESIAS